MNDSDAVRAGLRPVPAWLTVYLEQRIDAGVWRWVYTQPRADGEPVVLPCSTAYGSAEEASSAARSAYPGVWLQVAGQEPPTRSRRLPPSVLLLVVGTIALVVLVRLRRPRTSGCRPRQSVFN